MKRERLLMIVILVLVLLNSATLIYIYIWTWNQPISSHERNRRPDKLIIERLKLDEEQQKQFEELKHEHHSAVVKLDEQSRELHKQYFALLEKEEINDSIVDGFEKQLAAITERKEEVTFDHFKKLKAICKPDQIKLFNDFIGELGKILSGPPHPPGPPPPPR